LRLLIFTISGNWIEIEAVVGRWRDLSMIYKGVEFTVTAVSPGIWKWQFLIGDRVVAGKTEAKLSLLAIRRVSFGSTAS
jgi:hypothetical protein